MNTTNPANMIPLTSAKAPAPTHEITVALPTLENLFNAPSVNPFEDRDLRWAGEPVVERIIHQLQMTGRRDRRPIRVRVRVPMNRLPDQIGTPQIQDAIHRYCQAKIADNEQRITIIRRLARRGLAIAALLVLLLALLAYWLLTSALASAGIIIQAIIAGSVSVFAWVVLWDTLEALIFNPIPLRFENRALARLANAEIVVEVMEAVAE
ncbi:MAG TPA: hypothetical protein VFY89_00430 [Ktedonobacterales bacterium]